MGIHAATRAYEDRLRRQVAVDRAALGQQHERMAADPGDFLRASYYRWAGRFAAVSPEAARAAPVLALGDVHAENFGTWQDTEGRLVFGAKWLTRGATAMHDQVLADWKQWRAAGRGKRD